MTVVIAKLTVHTLMSTGGNSKRHSSKYDTAILKFSTTPTGGYVLTPRNVVCPGAFVGRRTSQQRKASSKVSLKGKRTSPILPIEAEPTHDALVITAGQGSIELHFKALEFSALGERQITQLFEGETPFIRMSWKFLSFERNFLNIGIAGKLGYQIETSVLYKVDVNENLIDYLMSKDIALELYGNTEREEKFIAKGVIKLKDVLDYPGTELYAYIDFCDVDKALVLSNTGITVVFGTLIMWYRLNCDLDSLQPVSKGHIFYSASTSAADKPNADKAASSVRRVSMLGQLKTQDSQRSLKSSIRSCAIAFDLAGSTSSESESIDSLEPTDSEIESFKEALSLVLTRNKALRITQSEISNELKDRARWLHEESKWKRTLQEHAILCGEDPTKVEWRQWRDENTSKVRLRSYPSQVTIYDPLVELTIVHLKLYSYSAPVKNNRLKKFYVEYAFLGEEVECPESVEKSLSGKKMVFNYTKTFNIDPILYPDKAKQLANAVKNKENINFTVVAVPEIDPTVPLCCEELSSCSINLMDLMQLQKNAMSDGIPILYPNNASGVEVGYIQIRISGILAMRRVALQVLAPSGYTMLQ